ncbi:protein phosphatase 2C [Trypanosoma conorhini]|uniref:Protein phosphatase n=1 Tax=Trypanosoma conorhini TaxID=83891 RepID=A0A3R7NAR5_9TRYP|nr:protein phosphatase 2C [Trypanosoma conorhini]RNF03361.1 protein phosphatase 2C [Trypanosoma conorhini]
MSRLLCGFGKPNLLSFYYRCVQFFPHPAKQDSGGEDAFLSLLGVQAVLDGVSWWRENTSVDAGLYSAALARAMYSYVEDELLGDNPPSSLAVLQRAYDMCKADEIEGTATALVATLQPPTEDEAALMGVRGGYGNCILDVCSVGDCTALIVRRGRIVFMTDEQTHDLDFPYQLGQGSSDVPSRGLKYRFPVECGDLLFLGSDGVFDNVFPHRAADLVWSVVNEVRLQHSPGMQVPLRTGGGRVELFEETMRALAKGSEDVVREARSCARDLHADTPYARKAVAGGAYYEGGKQDDMTLLVSVIGEMDADSGERTFRGAVMNPYPYRDWP